MAPALIATRDSFNVSLVIDNGTGNYTRVSLSNFYDNKLFTCPHKHHLTKTDSSGGVDTFRLKVRHLYCNNRETELVYVSSATGEQIRCIFISNPRRPRMSEVKTDSVVNVSGDNDSGIDLSTNDVVAIKTADTERCEGQQRW